jgi:twinkle protein
VSVDRKGDWVVWNCHHCGDKGSAPINEWKSKKKVERPSFKVDVNSGIANDAVEYLLLRGISEATCKLAQLFTCDRSFRSGQQTAIGFPNILNGNVVGVKYRGLNKEFSQEAGSEQVLWGQQFAKPPILIITEGEVDALSAVQCGLSAVSVPGGAPLRVSDGKIDPTEDRKFSYVWDAKELLDSMEKIILAVDNDEPGQALQEELARRVGKARCWTVEYPAGCKDLNDVLVRHGEQEVKNVISRAKPYPINGLFEADSYFAGVDERYQNGHGVGNSTGYSSVDELYTIVPGQMSVVTGWPSSGKSNFVDQVCVNLAKGKDWRFLMASFENPPQEHIIKLCEIFLGKPFYQGPTERMSQQELDLAKQWVRDHFLFLDVANGGTSLESILARGQAAVARMGIRGMVIDPYNYIDIERTGTEAADISNMLTRVNAFAKTNEVHIWFVAHPAKMLREGKELPVPDGMSISGSMAWWAKADCGITVHRADKEVMIKCWKSRWRWVGRTGEAFLQYDRASGTYEEVPF